jgi:hypothetical protein
MHSKRKVEWIAAKCARTLLTALLLAIAPEIAQAIPLLTATANAGSPSGTGCSTSDEGASAAAICNDGLGVSSASAFAQPGHVGAMGTGSTSDPFNSLQAIGVASASYSDVVTFHSIDPTITTAVVSMIVGVSGTLGTTPSGTASADVVVFGSFGADFHISVTGVSPPICSINGASCSGLPTTGLSSRHCQSSWHWTLRSPSDFSSM